MGFASFIASENWGLFTDYYYSEHKKTHHMIYLSHMAGSTFQCQAVSQNGNTITVKQDNQV